MLIFVIKVYGCYEQQCVNCYVFIKLLAGYLSVIHNASVSYIAIKSISLDFNQRVVKICLI